MELNLTPIESHKKTRRTSQFNLYLGCTKHKRRRIKMRNATRLSLLLLAVVWCTTTTTITITHAFHVDQRCQPTDSFVCNIDNYSTVQPFNNTLGHSSLEAARSSLHNPPDMTTQLLQPCRDICDEAYQCEPHIRSAMNTTWPSEWDCNKFQYYSETHKLCVIDNQKEVVSGGDPMRLPPPVLHSTVGVGGPSMNTRAPQTSTNLLPALVPTTATNAQDEVSICDQGFFDCRLSDPKRPLCIEMKYVCDGKRDCYRNDSMYEQNEGLDELDCKERCEEGQLHCDDKCISRYDICNGKVDCSSGVDEQDCIDSMTGIIQTILLLFVMSSVVYVVVRFIRAERDVEDKEQPSYESPYDIQSEASLPPTQPEVLKEALMTSEPYKQLPPTPLPQPPLVRSSPSCFDSTYQAPSILTRSDAYDTARIGGDSGACSVYAYGPLGTLRRASTPPPAPPAPPSTPLPAHSDSSEENDFLDPADFPAYFVTGYHDSHIYVNGYEGNGPNTTTYYGNPQQALTTSRMTGSFHTNHHRHDGPFAGSASLPHGHQAHRMMHDWCDGGRSSESPTAHSSGYHGVVENKSHVIRPDTIVMHT